MKPCKSCEYAVDRVSPDGPQGEYCSCACRAFGQVGRIYPIRKNAGIASRTSIEYGLIQNASRNRANPHSV